MRLISLLLFLCLQAPLDLAHQLQTLSTQLVTQLTPPVDGYPSAIHDRNVRPKPAPPVLGPAGSTFLDPTFGSRLWRATDALTAGGSSLRMPSSAHLAAWNANSSIFYAVTEGGGVVFFAFDPQVGPTKLPTVITSQLEPTFSYVDLSTIYGVIQHRIEKWNIITGVMSEVLNLDSLGLNLGADTYVGGLLTVDNDVWVTFFGGTGQDKHYYIRHSQAGLLDVRTKGNWKIHAISMDRTGRYVMVYPAVDPNTGQMPVGVAQVQVWDTLSGSLTPMSRLPGGHDSQGYGVSVNADCCSNSTWDAAQWQARSLATPNTSTDLIGTVLTPQHVYDAEHSNWRMAKPDVKVPFITSTYRQGAGISQVDYPWRAWDEEIIAVATDGSGEVSRFAHHQSVNPAQFWNQPIINCSPNGRFCTFTSNWGQPTGRQNVFVVQLR